jgi:hypothetical protein
VWVWSKFVLICMRVMCLLFAFLSTLLWIEATDVGNNMISKTGVRLEWPETRKDFHNYLTVGPCCKEKLSTTLRLFEVIDDMIMMDENLLLSNNQPSNVGMCNHVVSNTKSL